MNIARTGGFNVFFFQCISMMNSAAVTMFSWLDVKTW